MWWRIGKQFIEEWGTNRSAGGETPYPFRPEDTAHVATVLAFFALGDVQQ